MATRRHLFRLLAAAPLAAVGGAAPAGASLLLPRRDSVPAILLPRRPILSPELLEAVRRIAYDTTPIIPAASDPEEAA